MARRVQDAVDHLAHELGLSVLVEDLRQHPMWWCTVGPVDEVRRRTVLDRAVDRSAARVVAEFGLRRATGPVRVPALPERGMWARWAVPLRRDDQSLGLLWVLDPDGLVTDADLSAVTAVADLAADELAGIENAEATVLHSRRALLTRLLQGPDPEAADELIRIEQLPPDPLVQVESPARPGGWPLPQGMSAHVHRGRDRTATSGAPIPLLDLAEAVRRARVTRRAVQAGARPDPVSYDALGAWLLVVEAPDSLQPRSVHPAVEVLTAPPRSDLLRTARTVLDLGGDVTAAAAALHVHRTTLYYRLDRINALTGVDLRDGADRTSLQLALWLHAYRATPA